MNPTRPSGMHQVPIVLALCALITLGGCATRGSVQRQIDSARQEAYTTWQATREGTSPAGQDDLLVEARLGRDQAVALALDHNRGLQAVLQGKQIARGRILEAWEGVLPTVSLDGAYTRQDKDHAIYRGELQPLGQKDNRALTLGVTQPLYRGGAASAALKASRYYQVLADEQVRAAVQNTIFATIAAYKDALLARQQLEVTRVYVERAAAHLKDVETRRRFGTASDFNVLRARVDLTTARTEMISYQNALHTAEANLLKTMGISQESRLELTDTLVYEPIDAVEEEAIEQAFTRRPDLAIAHLGERLREESLNAAYSEYWPRLDAFYNHTLGKPDPYLAVDNDWGNAWHAGVRLSIPLFNGLGREGRIQQKKAELRQSHIELLDTQEQAIFEVRTALTNLRDARKSVETQQLSLEQAREGLRLAEVGYREGTLDQVSVLDARSALTQAQLLYYRSLYTHSLARVRLALVQGTLEIDATRKQKVN